MIVCLGDAVVDLVALGLAELPAWGEDREVPAIAMQLGGSGMHVATNMARLGHAVALLAGVGQDGWGRFLTDGAAGAGVSVAGMRPLSVPSAVTMVLSGHADRAFVSTYGATAAFGPEDLALDLLEQARHVHVCGLWQGRALHASLPALFDALRARGVTLSLDTGYDPTDRWGDPLPALLSRVDLFFPNEVEALRISGAGTLEAALSALAGQVPLVVLKQGAQGAIARRGGEYAARPAFQVEVVDTTGAGDAFAAAFLHGWLQGRPLADTLTLANAAGALAVTRIGASEHPPTDEALRAFIAATPTYP